MADLRVVEEAEKKVPLLHTIYFYLTEGCNCRCRHCWISPRFEVSDTPQWPYVELDLFKDIVEQARPLGLTGVKLTGGEPLIHPQIKEILEYLSTTELRVIIETNGIALNPEIAELIKRCHNPFVSISLDGSDAETHEWVRGVKGCFKASLLGVKTLVDVGIHPQIIFSLMKRNADQVDSIVRLAEEIGGSSVKYNVVTPTERGKQMQEAGETLTIDELIEIGKHIEGPLQDQTKVRLIYSQPDAFQSLKNLCTGKKGRCGIFGIIGVLGNGKYALCGIGENVSELVFGDARSRMLEEVWKENPVLNEIREGLPSKLNGICADCLMKNLCLGSCIAMNYYRHRDLFAPYWFCEEADKAGLFPKQRLRSS